MKQMNGWNMRMILVGIVAVIMLGGRGAQAEIIMSEPINVGPVINDAYDMQECDFSHDGLELYFCSDRPDGYGRGDIWVAKRNTLHSPWQEPVNLGPNVNSADSEIEPSISGDGLELYLGSWDDYTLRVCKRSSKDAPWGHPVKIGAPLGSLEEDLPVGSDDVYSSDISADGLSLYFASTRLGGYGKGDIWVATRASKNDPWTEPVHLGPNVNAGSEDWSPTISTDGLILIFNRGTNSTWASTRKSVDENWGPAVNLGIEKQGTVGWQHGPALSPDSSCLYLENYTSQWGGYGKGDYWQVDFTPIVNFNGDEIIDIDDLAILIEHWGEEDPSFDIGPLPLGDNRVDEADLETLMRYWGQEALDPSLIAHWQLDEMEGSMALDSISGEDAFVFGDPLWQSTGGMVNGALQLDGVDDCVITASTVNPADGPFSVVAWINGGVPGQTIISQQGSSDWLILDNEGQLITELKSGGRSESGPLISDTIITDGNWHRIGLVWDGSYRRLYVDGAEVIQDIESLSGLESTDRALYIGVGKDCTAGFFSGLIDDVRIYNRVVSP